MKLTSQKLKVVAVEHLKGEKEGKPWEMCILIANQENGIQERLAIPKELEEKLQKDKQITLVYELGYKGKAYAKEIQ